MKFALVSPQEVVLDGQRIAEVAETPFEIAQPLHWVPCDDDVATNTHYFVLKTNSIAPIPVKEK
jgi:hypothetical protein